MARKPNPDYSFAYVKGRAAGRWPEILSALAHVNSSYLTGRHGPCPKCGGTDRWRFTNLNDGGGGICNQCGKFGDGFALLQSLCGWDAKETLRRVAEHLGCQGGGNSSSGAGRNGKTDLQFAPALNPMLVVHFCKAKPPITIDALQCCHARQAYYQNERKVLAIPVWGQQLKNAEPVGFALYSATGGTLPRKAKDKETGKWNIIEQLKVKLTNKCDAGWLGPVEKIASATHIWKVEGVTDLLAWWSMANIPEGHVAITNAFGAGEQPKPWMIEMLAGKTVYTLHDADEPGRNGAMGHTDDADDFHPGWGNWIASKALSSRVPELPYPIKKNHGKDLRDFAQDRVDVFAELIRLVEVAPEVPAAELPGPRSTNSEDFETDLTPNEAIDDPHRLAVANIERYAALTDGGEIAHWRSEWFIYKPKHHCYRRTEAREFSSEVGWAIKEEFNRANIEAQRIWEDNRRKQQEETDKAGKPTPRPEARKVTKSLITNVLEATASINTIPSSIELNTHIPTRERKNWIAMENGIVDVDALIDDAEIEDVLLPHSPDWFSTVCLPYAFDPDAKCPVWENFLHRCMGGDQTLIDVLQEWTGYLLLPDTTHQKFLVNEGEGGNGKSVFLAGLQAMLGPDNCSHVTLEKFANRFDLTDTLGKLANLCGDMGEIDRVSEGHLKSFVSGDRMFFDRKGISGMNCVPTARLIFNTNNRPRFSDKSSGIWRRLILIPWRTTISKAERIIGMDQVTWWQNSGELPGIFMWAVIGLHRLQAQKAFTYSPVVEEEIAAYRREVNPAREFLLEHVEANQIGSEDSTFIPTRILYGAYRRWAEEQGNQPLSSPVFGKEIVRVFPRATREQKMVDFNSNGQVKTSRQWGYKGIHFSVDLIAGTEVNDMLF
jgi:P4 family phage/plasmid primase-like protien